MPALHGVLPQTWAHQSFMQSLWGGVLLKEVASVQKTAVVNLRGTSIGRHLICETTYLFHRSASIPPRQAYESLHELSKGWAPHLPQNEVW